MVELLLNFKILKVHFGKFMAKFGINIKKLSVEPRNCREAGMFCLGI